MKMQTILDILLVLLRVSKRLLVMIFRGLRLLLSAIINYSPATLKGWVGESTVNLRLHAKLNPEVYRIITNIMLPTDEGTTQVDHIVVSRYGIFVIETKNYKGWIFGKETDSQWTQQIYKYRNRFQNPLRQNYKHTKTLSELTGIPEKYIQSIVVFVGDSTFKTEMPPNVLMLGGLTKYIKSIQSPLIKDEQVQEITQVIQEWTATLTDKQKADHVKNLKKSH